MNPIYAYFYTTALAKMAIDTLGPQYRCSVPETTRPINGRPVMVTITLTEPPLVGEKFYPPQLLGNVISVILKYNGITNESNSIFDMEM